MTKLTAGVSHVGINVPDLNKTIGFFEALGFTKIGGQEDYPSVFVSDGTVMITIWKAKVENPADFDRRTNTGLHHLAINVPSKDALHEVHKVVSKIPGVVIEFGPQPAGKAPMTHMMCYEPCGIRIEFTYHGH